MCTVCPYTNYSLYVLVDGAMMSHALVAINRIGTMTYIETITL